MQSIGTNKSNGDFMRFQILSLSGGGFLGLYTASVLAALEETIGCPIARKFDLLAGTSVGGLIAIALANEVPARSIRDAFIKNGPEIFSVKSPPKGFIARKKALFLNARHAKYRASGLRRQLSP